MPRTFGFAEQDIIKNLLSVLRQAADTNLEVLFSKIDQQFDNPLRIRGSNPYDAFVHIEGNQVQMADGTGKSVPILSAQVLTVPDSTINFQTQATTGATFDITWPSSTVGQFRRLGLTLLPSGQIKALFSAEAASVGALANPGSLFVSSGIPIGWLDLECTHISGLFKTAGSATSIIENSVSGTARIVGFGSGGSASGSGSGSGTGDDLGSLLFRASFADELSELPGGATNSIESTGTNAQHDVVNGLWRLSYDASKTVTGTGTSMTLSGAPAFTLQPGDILRVGSEVRKIATVPTQTTPTIEAAFTTDPSAAACLVSQTVHTKNIYGMSVDGNPISASFSDTFSEILVDYEDTTTLNDAIFDIGSVPVIAFSASHSGAAGAWTNQSVRPTFMTDEVQSVPLLAAGSALYLRFFANFTSGSGAVNLLKYKAFMQKDSISPEGGVMNQSYAMLNGTGTPVNCSLSVVGGKTVVTLSGWTYAVGVNPSEAYGSLDVYLNGQLLPRFLDSTSTPDAYYTEYAVNAIQLDQDYSAQPLSIEILQRVSVIDSSSENVNNIASLQENALEGFQGFVHTSNLLTATNVAGTPAAGTFYSEITGRAAIADFTQDLRPRLGIERMTLQNVLHAQGEFGPNGEPVFKALNDKYDLVRFAGNWEMDGPGSQQGPYAISNSVGDFMEVTFYGTGLNLLMANFGNTDIRASLNGAVEGANLTPATLSTIMQGRGYSVNLNIPVVSGLALGTYTVKIRTASVGGNRPGYSGVEILNESTSVKTQPGKSYVGGKKLSLASQHSLIYSNSVTGTKGGRMVIYHAADGSIGRVFRPVDASQLTLNSANHSNEEVARVYYPHEFGAGQNSGFWDNTTSGGTRAFTLDDGLTSLVGNPSISLHSFINSSTTVVAARLNGAGCFLTINFIGTGLDITFNDDGVTRTVSDIQVDGVSIPSSGFSSSGNKPFVKRIVSGLPYGTHTVRVVSAAADAMIMNWIVYQPKKPALPSGSNELADFNVMANYVANATAGVDTIATGVMRKMLMREFSFSGTWASPSLNQTNISGFEVSTSTISSYLEVLFLGTGFEFRGRAETGYSANNTVSLQNLSAGGALLALDSTNFPGLTTGAYGGFGFSYGGALLDCNDSNTNGSAFRVSGLAFGLYKLRITNNTANPLRMDCLDVITPIHSHKSDIYADIQNSLSIGSQGISDNRRLTPIKESLLYKKAWAMGLPSIGSTTTTSTAFTTMQGVGCTIKTKEGALDIFYSIDLRQSAANGVQFQIMVDGKSYSPINEGDINACNNISGACIVPVAEGVHKVELLWRNLGAQTATAGSGGSNGKVLTVKEI